MKNLTAYNECNEREIGAMVGKAMCAYANWKESLKELGFADGDIARTLERQAAIAYKNEYEATVRCIDLLVRENVYEIQHVVRGRAEAELLDAQGTRRGRHEGKAEKAKRMLDRLLDRIGDMELDCDGEVYDELLKILYVLA